MYKPNESLCVHNSHVLCAERNCKKCGWNPECHKRRVEKLRRKYK